MHKQHPLSRALFCWKSMGIQQMKGYIRNIKILVFIHTEAYSPG